MNNAEKLAGRPYPPHVARIQRAFTTLHTAAYRLTNGTLGSTLLGMPMLLLTTWGRRSSQLRTAPLLYIEADEGFAIVASNGGAAKHPTWWFNLQAHPEALIQVGAERLIVRAEMASPLRRAELWPQLLAVYSQYADYQQRTPREIPVMLLQPVDTEWNG